LFTSARASLFVLSALMVILLAACAGQPAAVVIEGGDPAQGAQFIQQYGCHSCHRIPGIPGANSYVGPPLTNWSEREYIAGSLQNTPENLIFWIMFPQAVEPGTAMPNMGIEERQARDIAAYLYTLDSGQSNFWSQGE